MNRRQFFQSSSLLLSTAYLGFGCASLQRRRATGYLLSPAKVVTGDLNPTNGLVKINLSTWEVASAILPASMQGHGMVAIPGHKNLWLICTKRHTSQSSCLFDSKAMKVVQTIPATQGFSHYGHGAVDSRGNMYLVEESPQAGRSQLVVWSPAGKQVVGIIALSCLGTHDISPSLNKDIFAVGANNRSTNAMPGLFLINIKTQKVEKTILSFNKEAGIDHFKIAGNTAFAGIQYGEQSMAKRESLLAVANLNDKQFRPLILPQHLQSEVQPSSLSVEVNPDTKTVWASTSRRESRLKCHILSWNYESGKFLGATSFDGARGLALDKESQTLWATTGKTKLHDYMSPNPDIRDFSSKVSEFESHCYFHQEV